MTGFFTNYKDEHNEKQFDWANHKEVLKWDKMMLQYIFDKELLREYRGTLKKDTWITDRHWQQWRLLKIKKIFGISEDLFSHMQRDMANQMLSKEAELFTQEKEKMK